MTVAWGRAGLLAWPVFVELAAGLGAMRGPRDAGLEYGFKKAMEERKRISNVGSISLPPMLPALPSTVRGRGSMGGRLAKWPPWSGSTPGGVEATGQRWCRGSSLLDLSCHRLFHPEWSLRAWSRLGRSLEARRGEPQFDAASPRVSPAGEVAGPTER